MSIQNSSIVRLKLPTRLIDFLDDYVATGHIETNRTSFLKLLLGDFCTVYNMILSEEQIEQRDNLYQLFLADLNRNPESMGIRLYESLSDDDVRVRLEHVATNIVALGLYDFCYERFITSKV